jgi:hypothetical protein
MADNMMSAGKWAKELGVADKKLKDAIKAAGIEPDQKKGACAYYSKATITTVAKSIK